MVVYCSSDLSVELRAKLGDWFRVVHLLKMASAGKGNPRQLIIAGLGNALIGCVETFAGAEHSQATAHVGVICMAGTFPSPLRTPNSFHTATGCDLYLSRTNVQCVLKECPQTYTSQFQITI